MCDFRAVSALEAEVDDGGLVLFAVWVEGEYPPDVLEYEFMLFGAFDWGMFFKFVVPHAVDGFVVC